MLPVVLSANGPSDYRIANSLRFRSSANAYLSRTLGASGSKTTWAQSLCVKRGSLGANRALFSTSYTSLAETFVRFNSSDQLEFTTYTSGGTNYYSLVSNQVFRDPSAWYLIEVVFDTTNATASNRMRLYVNGVQITSFASAAYPPQNYAGQWNDSVYTHYIGAYEGTSAFFDGYLADINFIDGQALDPSYFGQISFETGVWIPKAYTGSYGTNGFHLNFSNGTSTTTLGYDSSGNGNNWTTNNISLTAGSTYDWMLDSPTPYQGSSYGVGNYAVLNAASIGTDCTLSDGNLGVSYGSAGTRNATMGTIGMSSGKWYFEFAYTSGSTPFPLVGISSKASSTDMPNYPGYNAYGWAYLNDGTKYNNGTGVAYGATWTTNDVIGVAFDADAGTLTFYKNGVSQGVAFTGLTSGPYYPAIGDGGGAATFTGWFNFGQRPFAYTPPSGYKSLCTYNLPSGTVTTSGSFTGNASADGPFIWLNGVPTAMTINGNAVTFGTHADKTAGGFKLRTSSSSYNASGSNTYSITTNGGVFKNQNAQGNP